ncbi:ligase-associated DNA damage response exonuclease [Sulfitobacter sp. JBTF-M27]|uniref:Ligase-associated DNA damage response exonuclease n=1 Tax=Sulfitobacter sediminilitoris TaxID=2698830 RepID=A0A6P0CGS8_9RHOB|nr:ligase-associated DNA damage response exonuclease [Sulfitobacter sediminilitoris]NEK24580.1 ligase-associated DNA damage response exonuclease [Sulfitobacter sediminilitoris]
MSRDPVLTFTDKGIYCPAGDFYIDPWRPVSRALITHGHSDHARWGMGTYLATDAALPVMRHRLGDISAESIAYGQVRQIGDARVSFHPAGHVPGSAQIRVEVAGEVFVASGDYKVIDDGVSEPFEPVKCHHFITESTFGLPVFRWTPQVDVAAEINAWWAQCASVGKTAFLGAYALGKAQRLLSMLDPAIGPILTHGAVENTNAVMREQGITLPDTIQATADIDPKDYPGALVLAPPSALGSKWARKFGAQESAFASGWMALRGVRRRRAGDRGFVISDHADWSGLLWAIKETGAKNIYVTHGYMDIFTRYLNDNGWAAQVVPTQFEGESLDQGEEV